MTERIYTLRIPEALLRTIDAGLQQGLPVREAQLAIGLMNVLVNESQRSPCTACKHRSSDGQCASPALPEIEGLSPQGAVALASAFAHCTMKG